MAQIFSEKRLKFPSTYFAAIECEIMRGKTRIRILGDPNSLSLLDSYFSKRIKELKKVHEDDQEIVYEESLGYS